MNILSLHAMFTSYEATLSYLYKNLPMFQRVGAVAYKGDLSNTIKLCEVLGNPQHEFKSVHIAGTNGKGSTSHMLASILQSAGYKTGLYTSPHLKDFTERIRINGVPVEKEYIIDFVNRIQPYIEEIQPSFFEINVAMAFDYFAKQKVDIAIVEVGLGGRLDSTNIINPEVSVITNIGWDHKNILGDTLEKIAVEKAGIIKPAIPVVVSERQPGIAEIFSTVAANVNSPIHFAADNFEIIQKSVNHEWKYDMVKNGRSLFSDIKLPLQGSYQRKNLAGVLQTIEILVDSGWAISNENIAGGLLQVVRQTGLKGRWQKLNDKPLTICDTGHNIDGMKELVQQIKMQPYKNLHMVLGMVNDKDIDEVLAILPKDAMYYFCEAKIPRALAAAALAEQAAYKGLKGVVVPDVNEAIRLANTKATANDMIFIGGSTFVVAEIDNL